MIHRAGVLRCPDDEQNSWGTIKTPSLGNRVYRGERDRNASESNRVWIEIKTDPELPPEQAPLALHLEVRNLSPAGFAWGYGGSGPAQLALALLMDALGDKDMALEHHQDFKRERVGHWGDEWSISAEEIQFYILSKVTQERPEVLPKFPFGSVVATPGVLREVPPGDLQTALSRHTTGDWGELGEDDWYANEEALREGGRLFSAYVTADDKKFWIITESSRSHTTLLLPEEY